MFILKKGNKKQYFYQTWTCFLFFKKDGSITLEESIHYRIEGKLTIDPKLGELNTKSFDNLMIHLFSEKRIEKDMMDFFCGLCDQDVIRMLIGYYVLSEDLFVKFFKVISKVFFFCQSWDIYVT